MEMSADLFYLYVLFWLILKCHFTIEATKVKGLSLVFNNSTSFFPSSIMPKTGSLVVFLTSFR